VNAIRCSVNPPRVRFKVWPDARHAQPATENRLLAASRRVECERLAPHTEDASLAWNHIFACECYPVLKWKFDDFLL